MSYERIISKNRKVALIFPFSLVLRNNPYTENYISNYYFSPGLKIYPGKRKKTIIYAIGSALFFGYNGSQIYDWGPSLDHAFHFGLLINNYIHFQISKHFGLGLSGGFGLRYLDIKFSKDYPKGMSKKSYFPSKATGQVTFNYNYHF